jgi:hypothetical protein
VRRRFLSNPIPQQAQPAGTLDTPWTVAFQPGRGAPTSALTLRRPQSLADSPDPGVKYFSGVSTWTSTFVAPVEWKPGATPVAFVTIPTYKPDAPLRPSGLIGPVTLGVRAD